MRKAMLALTQEQAVEIAKRGAACHEALLCGAHLLGQEQHEAEAAAQLERIPAAPDPLLQDKAICRIADDIYPTLATAGCT